MNRLGTKILHCFFDNTRNNLEARLPCLNRIITHIHNKLWVVPSLAPVERMEKEIKWRLKCFT